MKRLERVYCRAFQGVFRAALPFMPYREPKILHSIVQIPDVLQERNISKVLLVTDESIRGLGLTKHLEEELRRRSIFCAVYDKVVANPTIQNIEQARAVYLKSGGAGNDCLWRRLCDGLREGNGSKNCEAEEACL